jgi:hypothetical protein
LPIFPFFVSGFGSLFLAAFSFLFLFFFTPCFWNIFANMANSLKFSYAALSCLIFSWVLQWQPNFSGRLRQVCSSLDITLPQQRKRSLLPTPGLSQKLSVLDSPTIPF